MGDGGEGIVTLYYRIDTTSGPIEKKGPLTDRLTTSEKELESQFGVSVSGRYPIELTLEGTESNLRKAIEYLIDSYGFPPRVARPILEMQVVLEEDRGKEWEKMKRGYELFKQIIEEKGGRLSFFGPYEDTDKRYRSSYISVE